MNYIQIIIEGVGSGCAAPRALQGGGVEGLGGQDA